LDIFIKLLGATGIYVTVGIVSFLFVFRYAQDIFKWFEDKTFSTREYVFQKLQDLFIEVKDEHVTYAIMFLSFGTATIVFITFGLLKFWKLGFFLSIFALFAGWKAPRPIIDFLVKRRVKAYSEQMVDALTLLGNGIRAGLSVPQSLGMVVDELPAPISQEFNIILQQNKIGVPLEECFDNLGVRIPTEDNDMFISSMNILRETGGNLAETFDTIVEVIRERIRLQQKIDTYVAQGLFQGYTIFAMPFVIGGIYFASDPDSLTPMFTTNLGIFLTILALTFNFVGLFVIKKIVQIKV
jgi:tight adherence protein B